MLLPIRTLPEPTLALRYGSTVLLYHVGPRTLLLQLPVGGPQLIAVASRVTVDGTFDETDDRCRCSHWLWMTGASSGIGIGDLAMIARQRQRQRRVRAPLRLHPFYYW